MLRSRPRIVRGGWVSQIIEAAPDRTKCSKALRDTNDYERLRGACIQSGDKCNLRRRAAVVEVDIRRDRKVVRIDNARDQGRSLYSEGLDSRGGCLLHWG